MKVIWQIVVILQLSGWSAAERMMDSENLEAHSNVFQGKITYLTRQLMLAINNFLANISNILCFTSRFRQMSLKMCVYISKLIYAFPYRGWMLTLAVKWKLIGDQTCGLSFRIKLFIVFTVANQSGRSETITIMNMVYYITWCSLSYRTEDKV